MDVEEQIMSTHKPETCMAEDRIQKDGNGLWANVDLMGNVAQSKPADAMALSEEPVDGRVARAHRTKERIVRSLIDIGDRGGLRPTAAQLAESAAVSRRTFYLHFDGVDDVLAAAFEQRLSEASVSWQHTCALGSCSERVEGFCREWGEFLERMSTLYRATATREPLSVPLGNAYERSQEWVRSVVEWAFLPDLIFTEGLDEQCSVRAALHAVTSWNMWDGLRRAGSTFDEATATIARLLPAVLAR
jgi:TetR/AcrR family transcriptional regulator, regulator of autoinduction and epiphytic fitness